MAIEPRDIIRRGAELTGSDLLRAIEAGRVRVKGGPGNVSYQTRGDAVVRPVGPHPRRRVRFFGLLGSFERPDPAKEQWLYEFWEVIKTGPGWDGWTVKPQGRTHEGPFGKAYNFFEQVNPMDLSTLPPGFQLGPATSGLVVPFWEVLWADGETREVWFWAPNPIIGECA